VREVHPWIELRVVEGGRDDHANVGMGQPPVAILNPPMTVAARLAPAVRHCCRISASASRT
jgi:hypothetical protein